MNREEIEENVRDGFTGEIGLWTAVMIDAFFTLRDGQGNQDRARQWIEDPENIFFDFVADALECEPDRLRERIGKAVSRTRERPEIWKDRIRQSYQRKQGAAIRTRDDRRYIRT